MLKYLIICPMVFIAGYIDSIAGGGGLIALPTYMITGLPVHNCIATNKMSSFMGTGVATFQYARKGFIPWKLTIFCVPCAFIGSAIGANIALLLDDNIFKMIMLAVVPLTGGYVLFKKDLNPTGEELPFKITALISSCCALVIGIYDGFYGPGTGTFLILLLSGIAKMNLQKANGLTKAINFSTNISALVVFLMNGQVLFPLGIVAGCFNIAGNYLGSQRFEKGGSKIVRPVILIVMVIFFIKILVELLGIA